MTNVIEEKKRLDYKAHLYQMARNKLKEDAKKQMEQATDHLRKIMEEYDIKHPLRGQQYQDCPTLKQEYC